MNLKLCFHEHAFTEGRKTLCVVTSLYEDFWKVLTFVQRVKWQLQCLPLEPWVCSLSEAYTFPTYNMGREATNTEIGARSRGHLLSKWHREYGKWTCVEQPPFNLGMNHWPVSLAAWLSHLEYLSLSSLTYVPYAPSVPKHLVDQLLIPLNTT